jgi:hypothetical protein
MKPKAKTIQERFGFKDEDLLKPKHDEIVFWLDANIESIVGDLYPQEGWTVAQISAHEKSVERARSVWLDKIKEGYGLGAAEAKRITLLDAEIRNWRTHDDIDKERESRRRKEDYLQSLAQNFPHPGPVPRCPPRKIHSRKWEYAVMERNYIVGFVDFWVEIGDASVRLQGAESAGAFAPEWVVAFKPTNLLFEVKTEIPSFGELMRQINFYRAYEQGPFFVVSPDDRFKSTLASQGIGFVKYTG